MTGQHGPAALLAQVEAAALELWAAGQWRLATAVLPARLRDVLADAADRAITAHNAAADVRLELTRTDRWWSTGDDGPAGAAGMLLRYTGGPRHGLILRQPVNVFPRHCIPDAGAPPGVIRLAWVDADDQPDRPRYIPDGYDDRGRLLMVWRQPTLAEITDAADRAERAHRTAPARRERR